MCVGFRLCFVLTNATLVTIYCRRVQDALSAEQPGGPPLRVSLKTLLADKDANTGDESSDEDDQSTGTSTSHSSLTGSIATSATDVTADNDDYAASSQSSSSSEGGFGNGAGDDEWKPGALLAGFGSAALTHPMASSSVNKPFVAASIRCSLARHFQVEPSSVLVAEPVVDLEKAAKRGGTKAARRSNNAFEEKIRQTHRAAGNQNW